MGGYAKAWTDMFDDEWFVGLSNYDRGIYLQLFIYAKQKGDTGTIIERKLSICAALMSCDVRIFRRSLAKMQSSGKLSVVETPVKAEITITDYEYYQRLKKVEPRKSAAKVQQKCSTNAPIRREDKIRAEKITTPDKSGHKEAVVYFCKKYHKHFNIKYDFTKKDGAIVKRLLGTHGLKTLKLLIDRLFLTDDDFVAKQAGRTLGVLSACSNKLGQEVAKARKMKIYDLHERLRRKPTEEEIAKLFGEAPPNT